jgi:delta-aminolevulinic acid dehydratase/porphobilinogen synthase
MSQDSRGLKLIKVNKIDLIKQITANMENHIVEFEEAMEGFMLHALELLETEIKAIEDEEIPSNVIFQVPESHEKDYRDIIDLLEMSVDDELEITYEQFKQYIKDEWGWTLGFKNLLTAYNSVDIGSGRV